MQANTQPDFEVAIVGTGFSGLGMAIQLKLHGHDSFVVLEQSSKVGGTWRDNTYPGCACDVQSHLYSFSFAPNPNWSRMFAPQPEIRDYLEDCADRFNVRPKIRFDAAVTRAIWDDDSQLWQISLGNGDTVTARVFVPGIGPLSRPAIPTITGIEQFEGERWHSARWNHDYDLTGKRVAVVGTGASAIQIVPSIADEVSELHLFQRTPPWIIPKPDRAISQKRRRLFKRIPSMQRMARRAIYWALESRALGFTVDPRVMKLGEKMAKRHIASQIESSDLRRKVTPSYTMGCKRVLISDDYYPALTRENVELVTDPITHVTPKGIVTADGAEREIDVLIYGTGFRVQEPIDAGLIYGSNGVDLADVWADGGVRAYLGSAVAGFPNMFMLLGPNTGLSHNSMIYMAESQFTYVLGALEAMKQAAVTALDVREEVQNAYNDKLQAKLNGAVWQRGGCHSWYQDATGRNTAIWPDFTFRFRSATRQFDRASYRAITKPIEPARSPKEVAAS